MIIILFFLNFCEIVKSKDKRKDNSEILATRVIKFAPKIKVTYDRISLLLYLKYLIYRNIYSVCMCYVFYYCTSHYGDESTTLLSLCAYMRTWQEG